MPTWVADSLRANLNELSSVVVACSRCSRLRNYATSIARRKKREFRNQVYWAKPVPGFGDSTARLLVIGLAPSAHGGTRTGRVFTGDSSGRFLVRALFEAGFANKPVSESLDDGLVYSDCYVTAAVKCSPPDDRPSRKEFSNCSPYLDAEISLLKNSKAVLVLGSLSFASYLAHLKRQGVSTQGCTFAHGRVCNFTGYPTLYASYHPSPRNTNTGVLTQKMLIRLLRRIKRDISQQ